MAKERSRGGSGLGVAFSAFCSDLSPLRTTQGTGIAQTMDLDALVRDRALTAKQKAKSLADWLLAHPDDGDRLVAIGKRAAPVDKATCLEAFEYATATHPEVGSARTFAFAAAALLDDAPRTKWEAAKLVTNLAPLHPRLCAKAIPGLLENATHEGTVVRWSAARALGAILGLETKQTATLLTRVEALCAAERDTAIQKHYLKALKKLVKAKPAPRAKRATASSATPRRASSRARRDPTRTAARR